MSLEMGPISASLLEKFAASVTPLYFTFLVGVGYCFTDVLKLDFAPALSVLLSYIGLPAILFLRIAEQDPSALDLRLLGADALSKLAAIVVMLIWWKFFSKLGKVESMEWTVTFFMLNTLPNTVILGDQVLSPMFEVDVKTQTTTIIFAQSLYWYNCVILMMEIREMFIEDEREKALAGMTRIPGEFPGELGDMEKSRQSWDVGRPSSAWEGNRQSPWDGGSVWEMNRPSIDQSRPNWEIGRSSWSRAPYEFDLHDYSIATMTPLSMTPRSHATPNRVMTPGNSGMTPRRPFTPSRMNPGHLDPGHSFPGVTPSRLNREDSIRSITPTRLDRELSIRSIVLSKGLESELDLDKDLETVDGATQPHVLSQIAKTLSRVLKRMLQVPLLYGSALGFVWAINRWRMPSFMHNSIELCADSAILVAILLLGMVFVKNIYGARGCIPCGPKLLFAGFGARFLIAPLIMYICTLAFSIKGTLRSYAILQVIVPQGSMSFALAQIYGCKLSVITPAIYTQMIVFVPVILAYNAILQSLG